jgi:GT2 family glycosyltransferase
MNDIGSIFVIIPVHNRRAFTEQCLHSLRDQTFTQFTTIVVDDGSTDGTDDMVRAEFPEVQLMKGNGNLWWTGGINLGIQSALDQQASYVLTMNDDTVVEPDFIASMVEAAAEHPDAVFGAVDADKKTKKPLYAGQYNRWPYIKSTHLLDHLPDTRHQGLHEVELYHGRGLWIPIQVFEKIGLFDFQKFPHYLADFDFTCNAAKAGFKIYANFDTIVYSYPDESGEKKIKTKKNLSNYYQHLFSRRGGANLRDYTNYVVKNCPLPIIPIELSLGYARRLLGFWIH